jgi:NADH:ubiquinone oxidoreductase subunit F (NADH-binding)
VLNETDQETKLSEEDLNWMLQQAEYMAKYSLCPLGQSPILPLKSVLTYFKKELV